MSDSISDATTGEETAIEGYCGACDKDTTLVKCDDDLVSDCCHALSLPHADRPVNTPDDNF